MASLTLRDIPEDLYRKLARAAEENHRSLNREIIWRLEESIGPEPMTADEFFRIAEEISSSMPRMLTTEAVEEILRESEGGRL